MTSPQYIYIIAQSTPLEHPNSIPLPHDILEKTEEGQALLLRTFFRKVVSNLEKHGSTKE